MKYVLWTIILISSSYADGNVICSIYLYRTFINTYLHIIFYKGLYYGEQFVLGDFNT